MTLADQQGIGNVLMWVGAMMGCVVVMTAVILFVRHKMLSADAASPSGGLFEDLRAMHRKGQLSNEEYAAARAALTARLKEKGEIPPPGSLPPMGKGPTGSAPPNQRPKKT